MSKDSENAVVVKNLHKTFRLPNEQSSGLKQVILNTFRKNKKKGYTNQKVLNGISFEVKKGEFFGIVGKNGSGKSTLLKIISQIYSPEKGSVEINGSLTPFIELGVGFNPELTGRENIFLNGALLGFSKPEMQAMYDEIVDFAELHKFMDQKLKNYSSGMQVRLAFSIAIRADTDILVLDEVLAVGDAAFQKKCNDYFMSVKNSSKTIILVTHNMGSVEKYCDRALIISNGKIVKIGSPGDISDLYESENVSSANKPFNVEEHNKVKVNVRTLNKKNGVEKNIFKPNENIFSEIKISFLQDIEDVVADIRLYMNGLPMLISGNTKDEKIEIKGLKGSYITMTWILPAIFNDGNYSIGVKVYNARTKEVYFRNDNFYSIGIHGWDDPYRLIHLNESRIELN